MHMLDRSRFLELAESSDDHVYIHRCEKRFYVFNVFKNIFSNVRALKCLTETLTSTFGTIKTN